MLSGNPNLLTRGLPETILKMDKLKKMSAGNLYKATVQPPKEKLAIKPGMLLFHKLRTSLNLNKCSLLPYPGEQVLLTSRCHYITPFATREGEILVGRKHAYFLDMSEVDSAHPEEGNNLKTTKPSRHGKWVSNKTITLQYEDIKV